MDRTGVATPALPEFTRLARQYPVVPVWRDLPAAAHAPVGVFGRLGAEEGSVLLERAGEGADRPERFSVIGLDPHTTLLVHGEAVSWTDGPICPVPAGASLPETLRAVTRALRAPVVPDLPAGVGGAVAALGGDAWHQRPRPAGEAGPPDSAVVFPRMMIVFDRFVDRPEPAQGSGPRRMRLVANVLIDQRRPVPMQYADALSRLEELDELAGRRAAAPDPPASGPVAVPVTSAEVPFDSEIPDEAYRGMVEAAHRRILAGELRQVTVSRRFVAPAGADPLTVYQVLRASNPSPYHYLLRLPGVTLVGASPQGLLRVRGDEVRTHVIAGTRPRGSDAETDAALAGELRTDPKERAEHAMLVDLAQADLAQVAEPGTVRVSARARLVRYSRVMHLVSDVVGVLASAPSGNVPRTALDALAAVFPSGTVAGLPREAALRLIAEVEPVPRGLYGGAVGLLSFAGDLDVCLGIRALQFHGGRAYCQAGAGVVAESVAELEVRESRAKASALFAALAAAAGA